MDDLDGRYDRRVVEGPQPVRRIAHNDEGHEVCWWKVSGLLWVVLTSIMGSAVLAYMAGHLVGLW
jgi:hypothetical protein